MTVATKAQAVAMGILNAVMNANPILRIVTLLGFLVGAFVYAWKNSETFRNVVKNVWGAIQTAGGVAWRFLQDKVFSPFMAAIRAVGTAFGKTKDAIGTAWNAIKRIVAAPINFVIKYVYNNGIRWLYNKVASVVGLGQLPEAKEIKLAGGGVLGGYAPGRDSIHAMLSPGEAVLVPELVQQIGPRNILAANKRASGRNPGSTGGYSGGGVVGYAGGGVIGKVIDWVGGAAKGAVSALTDPVGFIKSKFGGGSWVSAIAGLPARLLSKLGNWLWNKIQLAGPDASFATGNVINGLKQWIARENIGSKRYEWGAVGPNTYDCSGLVGTLWALSQNKPPFRRYFTTATMGPGKFNMSSGFKKGGFNVYLGPGHTAANIGGMHVEAYGGNGTQLAVGRVGTNLSFYNRRMHVNGLAGGGIMGLRNDPEARMASWWKRGWPEPYVFDNGGIWKSGTLGVNNTGHDEIVINPKKTGLAKVEKHYHLHANVSNTPVDLVTQYTRMEMLEPPL
jgi:xanthosine utilization system XapX-like protein